MARKRKVERAKTSFLREAEDRDWLRAVGIGKVQERLGLIISVRPGAKAAASRLVDQLELDVPVLVRAVEEIRARVKSEVPVDEEGQSLDVLRRAALKRFRPLD